jgi:CheY-like chemotaxis protein
MVFERATTMHELKRILLVEDDPRDIELTLEALTENSLVNEVHVVRDGEEAVDYLNQTGRFANRSPGNPAVILLDLKLPKLDGVEVLRIVRGDARLKMIPVVVLTSSRQDRDIVETYKLGVNAYVVKPVNFTDFITAVKQIGLFWAIINEPPPGSLDNRSN